MAVEASWLPSSSWSACQARLQAQAPSGLVGSVGDCWVTGSIFDLDVELAS